MRKRVLRNDNDKIFCIIFVQVKNDLKDVSEESYGSTADFLTLQNFEKKFAEAEKLEIPDEELADYLDALERLKFNIEKVRF